MARNDKGTNIERSERGKELGGYKKKEEGWDEIEKRRKNKTWRRGQLGEKREEEEDEMEFM